MDESLFCDECGTLLSLAEFTEDRMIVYRIGDVLKAKDEILHRERYCANPQCRKDEAIVYEGGRDAEGIFAGS